MTYVAYLLWILTLVLAAGEIDNLFARRLCQRLKLSLPDTNWPTRTFLTVILPGLGQVLNGQPVKGLLLALWPFLTLWGAPIPRPWPLWALKTGWMLLPWWLIAIGDAMVVGWSRQRQLVVDRPAQGQGGLPANTVDYCAYRAKRRQSRNSGFSCD